MKCKNCKNLNSQIDWINGIKYPWCYVINDCPDIEFERECNKYDGKTNADRIRRMTDEELAEFLAYGISWREICKVCGVDCDDEGNCKSGVLKWLQRENNCFKE